MLMIFAQEAVYWLPIYFQLSTQFIKLISLFISVSHQHNTYNVGFYSITHWLIFCLPYCQNLAEQMTDWFRNQLIFTDMVMFTLY